MEQLTLEPILRPARPRTRAGDPGTSRAAAATVDRLPTLKRLILDALRARPMTDEELIEALRRAGVMGSPSGIRSRRAELVEDGLVVETGSHRPTETGRQATVWGVR